ncbi:MAG: PIN domain-containing protein [Salinibacterium sp.]|nr:PIN domain-containing protein [Salinibacterium sp.]
MTVVVDTSILIDFLGGDSRAFEAMRRWRSEGALHASEITRLEVLAGMRPSEEARTRATLSALVWHPVDEAIAESASALGRQWLPSHNSIDAADLAIAATAIALDAELATRNVRHFPMFRALESPY